MFFGKRIAKATRARVSGFSGKSGRGAARRVVANAASRGIEQLEERWMLSSSRAVGGNFIGTNGTAGIPMLATDVAGVIPQGNYNNLTTATGTAVPLVDSTGSSAAGMTATWSGPGFWAANYNAAFVPGNADQKLNDGFEFTGGTTTPVVVTVNNIPFAQYDVYVYILNDGGGRLTTTSNSATPGAGTQNYYLTTSTGPTDANHLSGKNNTYQYLQATSTDTNAPTAGADYVKFSGQTGSAFTFSSVGVGNGSVNGFQIVEDLPLGTPVLNTPQTANKQVNLSWDSVANTGGATYSVFRSDPVNTTPTAVATGLRGTSYVDTSVSNGTAYTYYVTATDASGTTQSNTQTVTPADGLHAFSVNFTGGGNAGQPATSVGPTGIAGVAPVSHFNDEGGAAGTNVTLLDSVGTSNNTTLTYTSDGTYSSHAGLILPGNADQSLNEGFVFSGTNVSATVNNIPFSHYNVYVYELNDAAGRVETTTANGVSYYGASADPADGQHITGANTPYLYTQSVSTDPNNPTAGGDYVKFAGTTSAFTFTASAPGNAYVNGFQIVDAPVAVPAAPVLGAPTPANNAVVLSWSGLDEYTSTIYRSDAGHPTPVAIATNLTTQTYTDNTAVNGTAYTYYVTSTNPLGTSANSNTKTVTPVPLPPVAPVLTPALITNPGSVTLNWNAPQFATSFDVKRGTALGGPFTTLATGLTSPTYIDTTATGNTIYYYAVTADNSGGASPNSNLVFAGLGLNTIAVNFAGGGNGGSAGVTMLPSDAGGVYATGNYNNFANAGNTNSALFDNTGVVLPTTTITTTAGGNYSAGNATVIPANADQKLNDGFIYGNGSVTITNIPYAHYDVYIFELNDAGGRVETTTANGVSYYGAAANPTDASHLSGSNTPYLYTQTTSTDPNNPTAGGDFVLYSGQTGSTFTFTTSAPGNGYLNGFEIVNHPIGVPTAPTVATPVVNDKYVRLTWAGSSDGVSYTVMRSDPGHPTAVAVGSNIIGNTFVDTTVTNGTAYSYYVVATNPYGSSGNSNTQIVTPTPVAPGPVTNFVASRPTPTSVLLTWTGAEFSQTYSVQRSTSLNGPFATIATGLNSPTYLDTTANQANNTDYYYIITASNTGGTSPASPTLFVGHGTGFTAQYYTSAALNTLILTGDDPNSILGFVRTDPTIDITGDATHPPPNVPSDWNTVQAGNDGQYFSVRWTGYLEAPVTGYYTLLPSSDDGIQVLYNGNVLQPSSITASRGLTEDTVPLVDATATPVLLTAGQKFLVQIDYNQGGGPWGAGFRWAVSSTIANQTSHTYDVMTPEFVQASNVVAPTPIFTTTDALGNQPKDQGYYTFTSAGLKLSWHDIGADSYNVYRATSPGGPYTKVNSSPIIGNATVGGGQDTFVDTGPGLVSGTTYYYVLTGVNGSGETPFDPNTGITNCGLSLTVTPLVISGTAGNDFIYVSEDPNTFGQVDYWVRSTPFATSPVGSIAPTGTINTNIGGAVNILGGGGTDVITLDLSHGDIRPDASLPVVIANSSSTTTLSLVGTGSGDTLQVDPEFLNTGGFAGTYFQVNGNSVALDLTNVDTIKVGAGATVNAYSGNVKVDAGTSATVAVNVNGTGGSINLAANQHLQSLIVNGGVANITGVVDVDFLFVDPSATVNVNNTLKVHYSGGTVLPAILTMLQTGRNNGAWNGLGISSTNAHASGTANALGYKDDGASVVTVKYVPNGDADLSGGVSFADLVAVAQHYGLSDGSGTWSTGDFNYDGNVNFADLVAVAQNYGRSLPAAPVASAPVSAPAASAPVQAAPAKPAPVTSKPVSSSAPVAAAVVVTAPPPIVAKPVTRTVGVGTSVNLSKPLPVTPPAVKPVKVTTTSPFAPTTQFRSQNQATSLVGDVLEKKPGSNKQLFL